MPQLFDSEEQAVRKAEELAPDHVGVIAWSREANSDLGDYGPPTTLFVDGETHIRRARDLWDAMRPFSTGGVYANNLGEEGMDRVLGRLVEGRAESALSLLR